MITRLELYVFCLVFMVKYTQCSILPPIGNEPSCRTCTTTTEATTTIHPYFRCDAAEYYVQGQCKNYTDAYCADKNHIIDALVPCGYSEAVVFKYIIVLLRQDKCNFYFSVATCVEKRILSVKPICSRAEVRHTLNLYIDDLTARPVGIQSMNLFLVDERCEVFSTTLALRLLNTNWSSMLNNTSSEYFWFQRDKHDTQVSALVSSTLPEFYRDSVVTNIRYINELILIQSTILWKENTDLTTSELKMMLRNQVNGSSTFKTVYNIETVQTENGSSCISEGLSYKSGEKFRTSDLCNRCVCNNGSLYCTNIDCSAVWLGEYCNTTSDCGVQHSACVNHTCECVQHYFGVMTGDTRICKKRELYESCSSVEDCRGPHVECNNQQCLCLNNYINVNNTCIFFSRYGDPCDNICYANYTECVTGTCQCIPGYWVTGNDTTCVLMPVETDKQTTTTIIIIVVCSVTLFILVLTLCLLFMRILSKNGVKRQGIRKKTLKNEETDENEYVPTSLHVKPHLTSTFYKARLAKPYMMGHFDFNKPDTDA